MPEYWRDPLRGYEFLGDHTAGGLCVNRTDALR